MGFSSALSKLSHSPSSSLPSSGTGSTGHWMEGLRCAAEVDQATRYCVKVLSFLIYVSEYTTLNLS